jgi:Maf1 regulator
MKYLEIPALETLNHRLLQLETQDQSKLYGRIEAYSCMYSALVQSLNYSYIFFFTFWWKGKFTGNDKKLYKRLSDRYQQQNINLEDLESAPEENEPIATLGSSPTSSTSNKFVLDAAHKLLYYLVSCMNLAFPDYDFRY